MLFNSQAFILLFLPVALGAFYLNAHAPARRSAVLLLASAVFYGWWDPRFVPMLAGSILGNWWLARRYRDLGAGLIIGVAVALNLGLLGVFKYSDFAATNLLALVGREHSPWNLVLPLGISFFTFEQISYLVDLRRGRAPQYKLAEYANFVLFFPHLIAGPIVRHNELIPQFRHDPRRTGMYERLVRGLVLFVLGLAKKVLFADAYAPAVDRLFAAVAAGQALGAADAWYAALGFSLQLYFDFSAYSDMAIGLAAMFGIQLPVNFDRPYCAVTLREFWRRWHMTLSRLLRDYVYIPLGGSRQSELAVAGAVLATMLLCGLWHGAGWTFVVWGALHGAGIIANRLWHASSGTMPPMLGWVATFVFVVAGWVLFRSTDFASAWRMLADMMGGHGWSGHVEHRAVAFVVLGLALATLGPNAVEVSNRAWVERRWVAVTTGIALVTMVLRIGYGRSVEFIYFHF